MKLARKLWKNIVGSLLVGSMTLTFGLGSTLDAMAKAAKTTQTPNIDRTVLLKQMLESIHTVEQVTWIVSATAKSGEEAKRIVDDVARKVGDKKIPKLSLAKNEITVDGKSTGIWVDPNGPLRVRYQGRTWKPDGTATAEQNYHSFMKFLVPTEVASPFGWLIPSARADEQGRHKAELLGGLGGLGVSALAGVLATVTAALAGPELLIAFFGLTFLAAGVWALGGAMTGATMYDKKLLREALAQLADAEKITVTCDQSQAVITASLKNGKQVKVGFGQEALSGDHEYARILAPNSADEGAVTYLSKKDALYQQMLKCKTDEQAQAMQAQLTAALGKVKVAMGHSKLIQVPESERTVPVTNGETSPAN